MNWRLTTIGLVLAWCCGAAQAGALLLDQRALLLEDSRLPREAAPAQQQVMR